ncbi:MAG TPA: hypothetical protein VMA34_16350 [Terracidiphilus sp.]|nr:hypothetical protein [Terracidiphilus sp.]
MDANQLKSLVQHYQENKKFISNEESTKMALVIPFIRLLGYDPGIPKEVRPEFCAEFTQGDGKKFPDRMDYAIFDSTGEKALMVFETKPLGADLGAKSQQLARYIAQMPDLHFGVITDGCSYQFFGDLEKPNVMDKEPFYAFALNDPKIDWDKVAKFLTKFSRESFNAQTLITEAENARYRQEMIDKLAKALKSPKDDDAFMQWLTADLYRGKRTVAVMARLGEVARDSIEPTLLKVMSDEFIERLREGLQRTLENDKDKPVAASLSKGNLTVKAGEKSNVEAAPPDSSAGTTAALKAWETRRQREAASTDSSVETSDEKQGFYRMVREICVEAGAPPEAILSKDTVYYFNISYNKPTFWFVRFFADTKRRNITTLVPVEEATGLAKGFEIEQAPAAFGVSRIYFSDLAQVRDLKFLIARSLGILQAQKAGSDLVGADT